MERVDGEVVFVGFQDRCCEGECLLEATLCEEELGFGQEEVWIRGEVVMGGEGLGCVVEFCGILVF